MAKHAKAKDTKKHRALAALHQGRLEQARALLTRVCEKDPGDAEARCLLGIAYARGGAFAEAEAAFRTAVRVQPKLFDAWLNLGRALVFQQRLDDAEAAYARAAALRPDSADAQALLADVRLRRNDLAGAMACYQALARLKPQGAEHRMMLATLQRSLALKREALATLDALVRQTPGFAPAHLLRAQILLDLGRFNDTAAAARDAQRLDPDSAEAIAVEITALERSGCANEALTKLSQLDDSQRRHPLLALTEARLCRLTGTCESVIATLENLLRAQPPIGDEGCESVHFALGQLYDQRKQWEDAFRHYQAANSARPHPLLPANRSDFFDILIRTFDREFISQSARAALPSDRLIFIIGMPRSGTTLTEQILAADASVFAAGELPVVNNIGGSLGVPMEDGQGTWRGLPPLTQQQANRLAAHYHDHLAELGAGVSRVTDKMPQNFMALGLIALLFPDARVVHCTRDPMDTCLSCYFQDFNSRHPYSSDLATLGRYYKDYQRIMAHWRATLELNMMELRYEDLVAEPEKVSRDLFEFCGLEWNEDCLRFFESTRAVNTASYEQVRRPIYSSSAGRWRHYAAHLAPLREALNLDD